MDIADHLHVQGSPEELCEIWESPVSEEFPLRDLGKRITLFCRKSDKAVILTVDEVDKNADNQIFLSFLGMLREKYLKQKSGRDDTFKSVIYHLEKGYMLSFHFNKMKQVGVREVILGDKILIEAIV